MFRKTDLSVVVLLALLPATAAAQATLMPSYNAPHRAFSQHEFGGTLSFPSGSFTGIEGQYRFGYRTFDIGLRGGILDTPVNTEVLLGAEARVRVLTNTEQFPLDGAIVFGIGTIGFDAVVIPGGLSVGRRIDIEDSNVSITPYAQPTVFFTANGGSELSFALGLGADFRLSSLFDLRGSFSVGDLEGFSISAVWVR